MELSRYNMNKVTWKLIEDNVVEELKDNADIKL